MQKLINICGNSNSYGIDNWLLAVKYQFVRNINESRTVNYFVHKLFVVNRCHCSDKQRKKWRETVNKKFL